MKQFNYSAIIAIFLITPMAWTQCPTHADYYAAVIDWETQTQVDDLIVIVNNLPGWDLLIDSAVLSLHKNPGLTPLTAIAEDETLAFTLRHWGNDCVTTRITAAISSGDGVLTREPDVINPTYIDVPFTFENNGPGDLNISLVLEDSLGAPILESTLSLHIKALYLLSVDLAGGTSGTPATSQYYPENEAVAYGFSPDDCYEMATFLDGELVLNSGSLTMDQDHVLATDAAWLEYNLTVNHGAGGTTDRDGVSPIACNGSLTLTATADPCFSFTGWSGDATGETNPLTLTNISQDLNITANFTPLIVIPDANFKSFLIANYDTNHDGEICQAEALAVTTLDCASRSISDLTGIGHFTNLQLLYCNQNLLTSLPDLSALTHLTHLCCYYNQLTSLPDLSALTNLQDLECYYNQLTSLPDLSALTKLQYLYCMSNQLTSLPDLTASTALIQLLCYSNQLTSLPDLSNLTNLERLQVYSNQLTSLPALSTLTKLIQLSCNSNQLTSLPDLSALTSMLYLFCQSNQLTSMPNLSTLTNLQQLSCDSNQLTSMPDLSGLTDLLTVHCNSNLLTTLPDVSGLPNLLGFRCQGNHFDEGDCADIEAVEALGISQFIWNPQYDGSTLACP